MVRFPELHLSDFIQRGFLYVKEHCPSLSGLSAKTIEKVNFAAQEALKCLSNFFTQFPFYCYFGYRTEENQVQLSTQGKETIPLQTPLLIPTPIQEPNSAILSSGPSAASTEEIHEVEPAPLPVELPIVSFYLGQKTNSKGLTLAQTLALANDKGLTEADFTWLFPISTPIPTYPNAPLLDEGTIHSFKQDRLLKENFKLAFSRALNWFGYELDGTQNLVTAAKDFKDRKAEWVKQDSSHFKTISRILRSAFLVGFKDCAEAFLKALETTKSKNPTMITETVYRNWKLAFFEIKKVESSTSTEGACPCSSGSSYSNCCSPYHEGKKEPEKVVDFFRARFSAYAKKDNNYLMRTVSTEMLGFENWNVELSIFLPRSNFQKFEILDVNEKKDCAIISSISYFILNGANKIATERTFYKKIDGRWRYLGGESVLEERRNWKAGDFNRFYEMKREFATQRD